MSLKKLTATVTTLLLVAPAAYGQSIIDQCRAYALAIEAVAEARDNLDQPSWNELLKLHPILQKTGKNDRAVMYAELINLRIANKNATPHALKINAFEKCPASYFCAFLNEGCPNK